MKFKSLTVVDPAIKKGGARLNEIYKLMDFGASFQGLTQVKFLGILQPPQISQIMNIYTLDLLMCAKISGRNPIKFKKNPL